MAIKTYVGNKYYGIHTDVKPTNIFNGDTFYEYHTVNLKVNLYLAYEGSWNLLLVREIDDSGSSASVLWSASKIISELSNKVDVIAGKGLSEEDFTTTLKNKLDGLESSKFVGQYTSLANLIAAHPTAAVGSYAYVDAGVGDPVQKYIWDSNDEEWAGPLSTSDLTPAQVKSLYEQNTDTNAFTDAEQTAVAANTAARHTQGSDQALDTGGANEVTAAALKDHLDNHPVEEPGGSTTQVQYNDAGVFAGDVAHTWDKTNKVLGVGGYVKLTEGGIEPTTALNQAAFGIDTEIIGPDTMVTIFLKTNDGKVIISQFSKPT